LGKIRVIGYLELAVIAVLALLLFRADELGAMLKTGRELKAKWQEQKKEVADVVVKPMKEALQELKSDIEASEEKHR
jgi:hypothetical protein